LASAWGSSWASAWGDSWGTIGTTTTATAVDHGAGSGGRKKKRKLIPVPSLQAQEPYETPQVAQETPQPIPPEPRRSEVAEPLEERIFEVNAKIAELMSLANYARNDAEELAIRMRIQHEKWRLAQEETEMALVLILLDY
jgi:hypothetical protein